MLAREVNHANRRSFSRGTLSIACITGMPRCASRLPRRGAVPSSPVGLTSARLAKRSGASVAARAANSHPSDSAATSNRWSPWRDAASLSIASTASVMSLGE